MSAYKRYCFSAGRGEEEIAVYFKKKSNRVSKIIPSYLIILASLLFSTFSLSETRDWQPKIETAREKAEFLLQIQEEIPSFFEDKGNFDIDLMNLLDRQRDIQKKLDKNKQYVEATEHVRPLKEITFQYKIQAPKTKLNLNHEAFLKTLPKLLANIQSIRNRELLNSLMEEQLKQLNIISKDNLLVGLINSLPEEERSFIFKESDLSKKIELIFQALPQELSDNFRFQNFGWSTMPSKNEVWSALRESIKIEEAFDLNLLTYLCVMDSNGALKSDAEIIRITQDLTLNPEIILQKIQLANNVTQLTDLQSDIKVGPKNLKLQLSRIQKSLALKEKENIAELRKKIILREVSPAVGIFRGCAGKDCSSSVSFPYPNDPYERTYFIFDEENKIKGYATGTIVNSKKERGYYLITIAGPRLSEEDSELIIKGLNFAKKDLDFNALLLPGDTSSLINYEEINLAYSKASKSAKVASISYNNKSTRRLIEKISEQDDGADYDFMSNNKKAFYIEPENLENSISYEIKNRPSEIKKFTIPTKNEFNKLLLSLYLMQKNYDRREFVSEVLKIINLSEVEFLNWSNKIQNRDQLNYASYMAYLNSLFENEKELNTFISKDYPRFFEAISRVSDLSEPSVQSKVFSQLEKIVYHTNSDVHGRLIGNVFASHNVIRSPDHLEKLLKMVILKANNQILDQLIDFVFPYSHTRGMTDLLKLLINRGDSRIRKRVVEFVLLNPHPNTKELLEELLKYNEPDLLKLYAKVFFRGGETPNQKELIPFLLERAGPESYPDIVKYIFANSKCSQCADYLDLLIRKGDSKVHVAIIKEVYSKGLIIPSKLQVRHLMIENHPDVLISLAHEVFSKPYSKNWEDLIQTLVKNKDPEVLRSLAVFVFKQPHMKSRVDLIEKLIRKGNTDVRIALAQYVFSQTHSKNMSHLLELLIDLSGNEVLREIASSVFSKPHAKNLQHLVEKVIHKGNQETLLILAEDGLFQNSFQNSDYLLSKIISKSNQNTLELLVRKDLNGAISKNYPNSIRLIAEKGNNATLQKLVENVFDELKPEKYSEKYVDILKLIAERGSQDVLLSIAYGEVYKNNTKNLHNIAEIVIERGNTDVILVFIKRWLRRSSAREWVDIVQSIVNKKNKELNKVLVTHFFYEPHSLKMAHLLEEILLSNPKVFKPLIEESVLNRNHGKKPEFRRVRAALKLNTPKEMAEYLQIHSLCNQEKVNVIKNLVD